MITTRQVNINLSKGKPKLRHVTTKDINVGVRVEPPKVPIKTKSITTTTLPDVADLAEKKRRDDIMAERRLAMKDAKKIAIAEKKKTIGEIKLPLEKAPQLIDEEKKPWKEMTDEEKKLRMKERMAKVRATKARKKKEREKREA